MDNSSTESEFDKVIQDLTKLAAEEALGNKEQLNTARRVFIPANSPK